MQRVKATKIAQAGNIHNTCTKFRVEILTADKDRHPNNPEYWAWRTAVFERDNGSCQICGGKGHEVHHILGWTRDPDRRYDVNNGITLCISCHEKTDNYYRPGFKFKGKKRKRAKTPITKRVNYKPTAVTSGDFFHMQVHDIELKETDKTKFGSKWGTIGTILFALTPFLVYGSCAIVGSNKPWWHYAIVGIAGTLLWILAFWLQDKFNK